MRILSAIFALSILLISCYNLALTLLLWIICKRGQEVGAGCGPLLVVFEGVKEAMVYLYIPTYYEI